MHSSIMHYVESKIYTSRKQQHLAFLNVSFYNLLSRTLSTPFSLFTSLQTYILCVFAAALTLVLKLQHPDSAKVTMLSVVGQKSVL